MGRGEKEPAVVAGIYSEAIRGEQKDALAAHGSYPGEEVAPYSGRWRSEPRLRKG